jgi:hypothetical protein
MKRLSIQSGGMLLFLVFWVIPFIASAQPITYDTGFQVQNLDTGDAAAIQIDYYRQDGTVEASVSDTIPAGGSKTYFPLNNVPDKFNGSVVISADRDIRAICNITGNGRNYYASYGGFTEGSVTAYAPLLMHDNNGFNTWFNVQNIGSSVTDVRVTYSDGESNVFSDLQPGAACTFDQKSETHDKGWVGSAVISASQPVAVTVMEVGSTTLFAYNGFASGSIDMVMPLINANNNGYITGVQIMNVGTVDTGVTLTYTPSLAGDPAGETKTVRAGKSETFAVNFFQNMFVGSARVSGNTENQPLVAVVNQLKRSANKGAAYEGLDPAKATETVVMPLIMDRVSGYFTGFSVVNVGSTATTVDCSFSGTSFTIIGRSLEPGEAMTEIQQGEITQGYVGSCICKANGNGKIMGIVNEVNNSLKGDSLLVYDSFNQ